MTKRGKRTLGLALRFWPNANSDAWKETLRALWHWEPTLDARTFQVMTGPGDLPIAKDIPWQAQHLDVLASLCAGTERFSWIVAGEDWHILDCGTFAGRVVIDIQIPGTTTPSVERWVDLFARMPQGNLPGYSLVLHLDEEYDLPDQGMRKLHTLSSIVQLDAHAVERLGGREHVRAAPCSVVDLVGGALLLVINEDIYVHSQTTRERIAAVQAHLGISEDTPLALIA